MAVPLTGARFDGADLREADLTQAVLAGADLSRARGLTQDQLDDACADGRTRVPPGLVAKACSSGGAGRLLVKMVPPMPPIPPVPVGPIPVKPRFLIAGE